MDEFGRRAPGAGAGRGRGATLPAYMTNPDRYGGYPRGSSTSRFDHSNRAGGRQERPKFQQEERYRWQPRDRAWPSREPQPHRYEQAQSAPRRGFRSEAELVARARERRRLPTPWIWGQDPGPAKVLDVADEEPASPRNVSRDEAESIKGVHSGKDLKVSSSTSSSSSSSSAAAGQHMEQIAHRYSSLGSKSGDSDMQSHVGKSVPMDGESAGAAGIGAREASSRDGSGPAGAKSGSDDDSDEEEGPLPAAGAVLGEDALKRRALERQAAREQAGSSAGRGTGGFGGALRPGEGEAMAKFAAEGQRIPRRGEVSWSGDYISMLEGLGYVMTGSRNKRMEEVRLRKEGQVYTAEERRALAQVSFEKQQEKEEALMSSIRDIVSSKGFGPSSGDGGSKDSGGTE